MNTTGSVTPMLDAEGYLTPEQFNQLIGYAKCNRDRVLFTFLFFTGRRIGEVVRSLTPKDLGFRDNMVNFTIEKRKGYRTWINVDANIMAMMKRYIDEEKIGDDDFIFPINRFRADQIIKDMGKRAGLEMVGRKKIHCHIMRHSFAVMMAKGMSPTTESLRKLQTLLGHVNVSATSYYLEHYSPKEIKEFLDKGMGEYTKNIL